MPTPSDAPVSRRPRRHASRATAVVVGLALALAACGSSSSSESSGDTSASGSGGEVETTNLTLGTVESITNLPVVLGLAKGYFEDEGINLKVEYMNSGVNIVPALASGQIDIGEGSVTPGTFNSFGREVNARVAAYKAGCAAGYDFCPLVIGESLQDDFVDWTSIKGKTVAISAKWSASHQKLHELDQKFGVSPSDYTLIEMPFADMSQALAGKAIDAAILIEPLATALEQKGVGTRVLEADMEPSVPVVFTSYSERLSKDTGPDSAGVRYQKAFIRAVRDIVAARDALDAGDPTLWNQLAELPEVSEAYPVLADPATRELVSIPEVRVEPFVTEDDFNTVRAFYISGDQLTPEGEAVTYEALVDPSFVRQALEGLQ